MEINASTYETIFLLYIDKELSQKESLEVDAFIAENPSYALLMEELKATVIAPEKLNYPFKANLKQQTTETALETIAIDEDEVEDWNPTYSNYLMQDMQAIPGLTTQFKNSLKKEATSKGILLKPFRFNQNKFAYAAVAALLMVFLGYQQLTKAPTYNTATSNVITMNTPVKKEDVLLQKSITKQTDNKATRMNHDNVSLVQNKISKNLDETVVQKNSIVYNTNLTTTQLIESDKTITAIEPTAFNTITTNNKSIPEKITNAITNTSVSVIESDLEQAMDATGPVSYEIIDTDDPNRAIYIANFEIDGNRLRGLKRKVNSLFKNNKSEKNE